MNALKSVLARHAPGLYDNLKDAMWQRRYAPISRAVKQTYGNKISTGPFEGMHYVGSAFGSQYFPKILGCYEAELFPVLEKIKQRGHRAIVNVGCAEGYYAVGMARLLPKTQVYAYDIASEARDLCTQLAQINGVADRVTVRGSCDVDTLAEMDLTDTLIFCDCEGYELDLLQPDRAASLRWSDILVELHDFLRPHLTSTLLERFRSTHDILLIDTEERDPEQIPTTRCISPALRRYAVDERRPGAMQWAFLTPRVH